MTALLELAPVFVLALVVLLWPGASTRLIEAIVEPPRRSPRASRKASSRRPQRSEVNRGRIFVALAGARAPPVCARPAFA